MIRVFIISISILLLTASCEQDEAFEPENVDYSKLSNYVGSFLDANQSSDVLAFAGNHRSFRLETPEHPIHVFVRQPEEASTLKIFVSDSTNLPERLDFYRELNLESVPVFEGFLKRYAVDRKNRNRLIRVSYVIDDSLFLSESISIQANPDTSEAFEEIEIENDFPGSADFSWSLRAELDFTLLLLSDRSGDVFNAVTTDRNRFRFFDLRNIQRNYTPELRSPSLIPNETYYLNLFGISSNGWIYSIGSRSFVHE